MLGPRLASTSALMISGATPTELSLMKFMEWSVSLTGKLVLAEERAGGQVGDQDAPALVAAADLHDQAVALRHHIVDDAADRHGQRGHAERRKGPRRRRLDEAIGDHGGDHDGADRQHGAQGNHRALEQPTALLYLMLHPSFRHVTPHPND